MLSVFGIGELKAIKKFRVTLDLTKAATVFSDAKESLLPEGQSWATLRQMRCPGGGKGCF